MAWRDNLRGASFRGANFFVERADSVVGRRTVTHEFPGREDPYVEDLGRRARRYSLEAYVIGPDYMTARDALRAAFERRGPGRLVHPYWGQLDVAVEGEIHLVESTAEGGMARFSVTLVEVGDAQVAPAVTPDTAARVRAAADAVETELATDFEKSWSVAGAVERVLQAAANLVQAAASSCRVAVGRVQSVVANLEEVVAAVDALEDVVNDRLALPGQVLGAVIDAYGSLCRNISDIGTAVAQALGLEGGNAGTTSATTVLARQPASSGPLSYATRIALLESALGQLTAFVGELPEVVGTTPTRRQQADNQGAFTRMVRTTAAIAVARAAVDPNLVYEDDRQALSLRDALVGAIGVVLLDASTSDALHAALLDLQASLHTHLTITAARVPQVVEYTPPGTVPALVLAYRLYGDGKRESEIVARNRAIRHPGFVSGGDTIKVLAHG